MSRPEATGHAAIFYNEKEARKYNSSSRMIGVQREITERAIELLRLPDCIADTSIVPSLILDIGCGSGLSGQVLEEKGHVWVGCDISRDMLLVAKERMNQQSQTVKDNRKINSSKDRMSDDDDNNDDNNSNDDEDDDDEFTTEANGDLLHHDMGTGLPFRSATFDACISISALQWLCYSNNKQHFPKKRLMRFFSSLYSVLKRGGRAVLQFYPETAEQAVLISETATSCGFTGGVVVDYPNSAKAKKHYLVLSFDRSASQKKGVVDANDIKQRKEQQQKQKQLHVASGSASAAAASGGSGTDHNKKNGKHKTVIRKKKGGIKTKEWILHKKDTERKRGKSVRPDTKYTARKRPTPF
jgi:18S rRNA (guanine1575-N7)-methyltransferase